MKEKNIILVVARFDDFKHSCQHLIRTRPGKGKFNHQKGTLEFPDVIYRHVERPEQMRGYHGVKVEFWDRAYELKDYNEMQAFVPIVEMK